METFPFDERNHPSQQPGRPRCTYFDRFSKLLGARCAIVEVYPNVVDFDPVVRIRSNRYFLEEFRRISLPGLRALSFYR